MLDERTGRIAGVTAREQDGARPRTFNARLVLAADGNSSRLSVAMGLHKRDDLTLATVPESSIPSAERLRSSR